jgi:thiol-disulfide isomerase/thioredoxin
MRGPEIKGLVPNQIYVVEFWATWCGPCLRALPHISELQKKYKDKVTFVAVSVWEYDQADLKPFWDKHGSSFGCAVATDFIESGKSSRDGGFFAKEWLAKAGIQAIPSTFIINGDGRIAWIGHPLDMDEPLSQIVSGDYKIESSPRYLKAVERREQEFFKRLATAEEKDDQAEIIKIADEMIAAGDLWGYREKVWALVKLGRVQEALEIVEKEMIPLPSIYANGLEMRMELMLTELHDRKTAYADARVLIDHEYKRSWAGLDAVARIILSPKTRPADRDLSIALEAAEKSVQLVREFQNLKTLLDVYRGLDRKDDAIKIVRELISMVPAERSQQLKALLKELGG